ncbi:hypothetical protein [Chelativorans sp. J32]|nr:hypothetical protein [Chelativorans sp. J32]
MTRNVVIAVVVAIVVILAIVLFLQPRGGNESGGQPPHATTNG